MDSMHLIDYLFATLGALLSIGWVVLFYSLRQNAAGVKETAALVLRESRLNAALVLSEKEKLEERFRKEYKALEDKFVAHQLLMAKEYATTILVEKIAMQVTNPILNKLDDLERKMDNKVDRREFERHEARVSEHEARTSGKA